MTGLDTRLHELGQLPVPPGPPVDELRRRAGRRRRQRRLVALASVLPVLALVVGVAVAATDEEEPEVQTVPVDPSPPPTENRTFGNVSGVSLTVTPSAELRDGDLVQVRVEGLSAIPGAVLVMCAGDVDANNATAACDFSAIPQPGVDGPAQVAAADVQTVSVSRILHLTHGSPEPDTVRAYDCATEPAGCVVAVGPMAFPVRGVAAPVTFADVPRPEPRMSVDRASGLTDGEEIDVRASGLRPNASLSVSLCAADPDLGCDQYSQAWGSTDARGELDVRVQAWALLYSWADVVDCTRQSCRVVIQDRSSEPAAQVPIAFAPGTPVTTPRLAIDPAGPYADRQDVVVRGAGFRPGIDVGGEIAQCPNGKDTRTEERCGRWSIASLIVGDDGSFALPYRLFAATPLGVSCVTEPGCHLGWVINHGPTVAAVPLTFRP